MPRDNGVEKFFNFHEQDKEVFYQKACDLGFLIIFLLLSSYLSFFFSNAFKRMTSRSKIYDIYPMLN